MQSLETISDMKFRVGYGIVGNEGIPPFSSLGTLEVTEAYFGENDIAKGAGPRTLNNAGLRWETTSQINIGMDLSLFDYRIQIVADYYSKYTRDLLLNAPVPYTSGFRNAFTNVGELRNYGFEFSVESYNITGPFQWISNFNIGFNENRIVRLTGQDDAGLVGRNILGINGWTRITEGQPVGTFYGFVSDGIVQLDDDPATVPRFPSYALSPGDRRYVDQNGDGILDESDRVILGDANPDFTFGLTNTWSYKNFRLEAFFQGVFGNEVVNFNRFSLESFDGTKNNSTAALERWTPQNPTNKFPRANATPPPNVLSDVQVEDGSYIRLQTLTLSYDLPQPLLDRLGIRTARVYVRGNNLWLLTNYTGYDPEVSRFANDNLSLGADLGSYPRARLYMAGITMSL
jgi:TonB-linked SusC/RagA family outer membrane protein